mmetsp:Transcript_13255/g.19061  ORF Transcript_13255/g.19061 Transcript_13255/m.19061 type:complete len:159 (-) Transcript_13255:499-975(-)
MTQEEDVTDTPEQPIPTQTQQQPTVHYQDTTGPKAQRQRRKNKAKISTTPRRATSTRANKQPTNKKAKTKPKTKHNPTHRHGTRANQSIQIAANAAVAFLHATFHGNAFNPDTNQIADYPELAKCSEGYYSESLQHTVPKKTTHVESASPSAATSLNT